MTAKVSSTLSVCLVCLFALIGCETSDPPVAGIQIEPEVLQLPFPGFVDLELTWTMELPLEGLIGQPFAFVHLVDDQGEVIRTFDHLLDFDWQPGRSERYATRLYQSALAPSVEPGTYDLTMGLYDSTGRRWPLRVEGETVGRYEYRVAEVEVGTESGGSPMFFFSPAWLPLESGLDAQVVARRWLGDSEGAIRVTDCPESGRIWMLIRIPSSGSGASQVVLEDEASTPEVRVSSTCGLEQICVSGPGFHEIEISLAPAEKELLEECELRFEPNFRLQEEGALTQRSMALEVVAWAE